MITHSLTAIILHRRTGADQVADRRRRYRFRATPAENLLWQLGKPAGKAAWTAAGRPIPTESA